jgi:hypothetical protein
MLVSRSRSKLGVSALSLGGEAYMDDCVTGADGAMRRMVVLGPGPPAPVPIERRAVAEGTGAPGLRDVPGKGEAIGSSSSTDMGRGEISGVVSVVECVLIVAPSVELPPLTCDEAALDTVVSVFELSPRRNPQDEAKALKEPMPKPHLIKDLGFNLQTYPSNCQSRTPLRFQLRQYGG